MEFTFKCPNCGEEYDGLEFLDTGDMDGEFNVACIEEACEHNFVVKFDTVITFTVK